MYSLHKHYVLFKGNFFLIGGEKVVKHNNSLLTMSGKFVARSIDEL